MSCAFIGLGSNLGDPLQHITQAFHELDELPETRLIRHSRLYRSKPMGPVAQPDYINAVAELETNITPIGLLSCLWDIEASHQRMRSEMRWGPRTLDLDLLIYDDLVLCESALTLPHPGLTERNFVLYPLYEIAPDLVIPGAGSLAGLIAHCTSDGLTAISDDGTVQLS